MSRDRFHVRWLWIGASLLALVGSSGCMIPVRVPGASPSLHLREVALEGDGRRRASTDLALQALDAEIGGDADRARGLYFRALQTDDSNPYAYLALARHHVERGDAARTFEHLDRAEDLLRSYAIDSPRVEVHLVGLRGLALRLEGRIAEGDRMLAQASRIAPGVWGDGNLSADELK